MSTQSAPSVPTKRLAAPILSTDMAFTVNNILSWDAVNNLVSADFGAYGFGCFRNAQNTQIEFFTFDPTTIANSTITILARGCDYKGGTTDGVKTKYNWPANQTLVELGGTVPALFEAYVDKTSDETINGLKTIPTNPIKGAATLAPTNDSYITKNDLLNAALGSVNTNQLMVAGTAGENLTKGWAIYQKVSDGKWYGTLTTASSTSEGVLLGIAQATVLSGASINVLLAGEDTNQTGLTIGALYYLQDAKGTIGTSAGTKSVVLGQAKSITNLLMSQRFTQVPTQQQVNALAGNSGTPDTGNVYVNQKGLQIQLENYAVTTGSANAYILALSPVPAAYVAGMVIRFKTNFANTGAATINVNSLGIVNLTKNGTTALVSGDLANGAVYTAVYDGAGFEIQTPSPNTLVVVPPMPQVLPGYAVTATADTVIAPSAINAANGDMYMAIGLASGTNFIRKFVKDAITGVYYFSGVSVQVETLFQPNKQVCITVVGSYVYAALNTAGTTFKLLRYDLGTLANGVAMTVSGTAPTGGSFVYPIFDDGTNLYIADGSAATTVKKYSISGTTATFVSSATFTSYGATPSWCDGTSVYQFDGDAINKWALAGGARSQTAVTFRAVIGIGNPGVANGTGMGIVGFNSTVVILMAADLMYNNTPNAIVSYRIFTMPVSKP